VTASPRVAHVTVAPEFVDRIMLHDLRRLRNREDITVVCEEGSSLARVRAEGFRVLTVKANRKISPLADLQTVWSLLRLFRREQFDLVHTYAPKAGLVGQLAAALAGVPHRVHGCRGLLYSRTTPNWQRLLLRATDRLTSRLAHLTLYLSTADLAFATGTRLCHPSRARHIGSGIDLEQFSPSAAARQEAVRWRREMGVEPDQILILSVGRYVADKGYSEIAKAAAALRARFPGARYVWVAPVFVGESEVLPADLPESVGAGGLVQLTGYIENIAPILLAADVLVHASHREGVPRVLMEAAAMGVPIVASDIPGCREVVRDKETALLFRAHDTRDLTAVLEQALSDPIALQERAERAAADVRARFSQEALSERVWSVHRALLKPASATIPAGAHG
jgi:glycosyltransferase involved in cell wall biosynthesis